ncbi:hypothetical protein BEL04_10285 [Mucilaginibacter sp. PPCGB 2223]|uniref:DUF4397 domain-containing protein n=1 Tax=Mucilaginibacter sp. PPCGB 2223 TaxID=1886027 RepID=UPI0008270823|nr:DUF4397 domain-containing protein [Mucilaginibacter sp. PPCGB 2223]OCX54610.1 hypothetical protein BEL04_10285 [Mucilaginibacter sp. PPCGB 2223]
MKFKTGKYLLFFCLTGLVFSSCKDNNDAPAVTTTSSINVVNLVVNSSSINYYANGTRQNSYKLAYGLASGYLTVASGEQIAGVKDTLYNTIYSADITLTKSTKYTLLTAGQASQAVSGILLTDTIATGSKARARFVNASVNAPAVDVYFNNTVVSNTGYKGISKVAVVDTGAVTVKINQAGTNTVILTKTFTLSSSGVYTFYGYGLYNGTGTNAFTLGEIVNN